MGEIKNVNVFRPSAKNVLERMSQEQTEQLCEWLLSTLTYEQILVKLKSEFDVTATRLALSKFYKIWVLPHLFRRRQAAVEMAAGYTDQVRKYPGNFTQATMDALEHKAMAACFDGSTSPKDLKIFLDLLLRWQEQKLREQQIELKLKRLEHLESKQKKAEEIFSSKLSPQEKAERCRLIFKQNGTTNSQEAPSLEGHRNGVTS